MNKATQAQASNETLKSLADDNMKLKAENERLRDAMTKNRRLVSERERNLEFCVCTFSDDGDIETLCGAHQELVDNAALEAKR